MFFALCECLALHLWVLWMFVFVLSEGTRAWGSSLCLLLIETLQILQKCVALVLMLVHVYLINRGYLWLLTLGVNTGVFW